MVVGGLATFYFTGHPLRPAAEDTGTGTPAAVQPAAKMDAPSAGPQSSDPAPEKALSSPASEPAPAKGPSNLTVEARSDLPEDADSPEQPVVQSPDASGRKEGPSGTAVGPKPRKRIVRRARSTAEILRGDPGTSTDSGAGSVRAQFVESLRRAILQEYEKTKSAGEETVEENYVIHVRVDLELNQMELVEIPANLSAALRKRWTLALANCSETLSVPRELAAMGNHYLDIKYYVGRK